MEQFLNSLGNSILLFIVLNIIFAIIGIYIIWSLVKTAIARGVEDGIYNAIVSLKNNGLISDTIAELEETKQIFNPNTPPTETEPQKTTANKIYQYKDKEVELTTSIPLIIIAGGVIIGIFLLLSL